MESAINYTDENFCPVCKTNNIEGYDIYNNPIKLSDLIAMKKRGREIKILKQLSYMRCKKCGNKFGLRWIEGNNLPHPMGNNIDIEIFMESYYKKGE